MEQAPPKARPLDSLWVILFVLATVMAPNLALAFAAERFEPYEHAGWALRLLWSIPVAVVTTGLMGLVARGMLGARLWVSGAMFAVIYGPVLAFQLVGFINIWLDSSPGTVHQVEVVRLERRQKGSNQLVVKSWQDSSSTLSLNAGMFPSSAYQPGARVQVRVRGGALGLSWVQPR